MDADDLTICVLTHNGRQVLKRCLDALFLARPEGTRLTVIDNGSTDGAGSVGLEYGATVIYADNQHGFLTGLNAAFSTASTPWVCFLQNDVLVRPDTFLPFFRTVFKPDGVTQLHLQNEDGSVNHIGGQYVWPGVGLGNRRLCPDYRFLPVDLFATAAFVMSAHTYRVVGAFDTALAPAYYEDVDYSLRLEQHGIGRYVARDAIATHLSTYTFHQTHTKLQLSALCRRNRRAVVQKHFTGLNRMARLAGLRVLDTLTTDRFHGDTYCPSSIT